MNRFDTRALERLTGAKGATLHRLLRRLKVAPSRSGVRRAVGLNEICRIALAMELHANHGLQRDEAASLAIAVPLEAWAEVVETEDRWLLASRPPGGRWSTAVTDQAGAARPLAAGDIRHQYLIVPLTPIARRVLEAAVQQETPGTGHA